MLLLQLNVSFAQAEVHKQTDFSFTFALLEMAERKKKPQQQRNCYNLHHRAGNSSDHWQGESIKASHSHCLAPSLPAQEPRGITLGCSPCPVKPRLVLETYITDANIRRLQGEGSAAGKGEQTNSRSDTRHRPELTARAHSQTLATSKPMGRDPLGGITHKGTPAL